MGKKPTYKELEQRIKGLEAKALESRQAEEALLKTEADNQSSFINRQFQIGEPGFHYEELQQRLKELEIESVIGKAC